MKIELKGYRGLSCYQAYLSAVFYLPLTQEYVGKDMAPKAVIVDFKQSDIERKKSILTQLYSVHHFSERDAIALVSVHKDANGVAYGQSNIGNLETAKLMSLIVESMLHCSLASEKLFF